jgi:hypothetical protein
MKAGCLTWNRRRIAVVAGVLAAAAVSVPALASQTVKIDSKVTLAIDKSDIFVAGGHGRVEASKHACEVDRKVKFVKVRGPQHPGRPDKVLGTDRTNRRGHWKVRISEGRLGGHRSFYAKVVRREVHTAGTTFVCRGDSSRVVATT